ncbi:MAG: tetratricopeptide repeat protein [Candidatus Eiseniibacteriota bacterium]
MGVRAAVLGVSFTTLAALGAAAGCRATAAGSLDVAELRAGALEASRTGDYITAVKLLRQALVVSPGDSLSYAYLADAFRRAGWTEEGYRVFRAAVAARGPQPPELRYYLAFFTAYSGHRDSAEQWLSEARAARPPSYAEAVTLSDVLLLHRRIDEALQLIEDAAARFPHRPEARVRLVTTLARLGRSAQATGEADRLVRDFPHDASALAVAAQLRYVVGDLDGAETYTHRWLALTPQDAEARWNLVRIALQRGQWTRADAHLTAVVETGH